MSFLFYCCETCVISPQKMEIFRSTELNDSVAKSFGQRKVESLALGTSWDRRQDSELCGPLRDVEPAASGQQCREPAEAGESGSGREFRGAPETPEVVHLMVPACCD